MKTPEHQGSRSLTSPQVEEREVGEFTAFKRACLQEERLVQEEVAFLKKVIHNSYG